MSKKGRIATYIISCLIALAVGGLSALVTQNSMAAFESIQKPALTPPSWVFPVVWTILFLLMGLSAAIIYRSQNSQKGLALTVYGLQLAVNFAWSIIFFNLRSYLFAFIWLILLLALIVLMIQQFYTISRKAGPMQLPYLIWVIFAGYLNWMIYLLNR